jgi:hypothetical protein
MKHIRTLFTSFSTVVLLHETSSLYHKLGIFLKPTLPHLTRKVISNFKTSVFQNHFYVQDRVNISPVKPTMVVRPEGKRQQARNKLRQPS